MKDKQIGEPIDFEQVREAWLVLRAAEKLESLYDGVEGFIRCFGIARTPLKDYSHLKIYVQYKSKSEKELSDLTSFEGLPVEVRALMVGHPAYRSNLK